MEYILIPIFNEALNIPNLAKEFHKFIEISDTFIVFSDDGSTDNTAESIKTYFVNYKHIFLSDGINRGPGIAFNEGFNYILQNSSSEQDIVITIEADCTSDLALLSNMIKVNKLGYDLVLASVYAQGGGFENTTFLRVLLSSIANLFFRFAFNIKVLTLSSFYRVYSMPILRELKEKHGAIIEEAGFICMLEILLKATKSNASVLELPMLLKSTNRIGKSKMKIFKTSIEYLKFYIRYFSKRD